jgi:hypothetical protein
MSNRVVVWLCTIMTLGALSAAPGLRPAPVLAASGTLTADTPLLDAPDPAAPVIALLTEGTVVSIDGPPVEGFYPVMAGDLSGWMRGETVQVEKDTAESVAAEEMETTVLVDDTVESVPVETPADLEPAPDATPASTIDPATDPAADPLPAADESSLLVETAPVNESVPVDPPDPDDAAAVAPIPAPDVSPVGPASVAVDAPIRTGPGPDFALIVTAPVGSTIQQTGHFIDGYVTVQYAEATGWIALEHLGVPGSIVDEAPPSDAAAVVGTPPVESPPAESPPLDPAPAETPLVETPIAETPPAATASVAATPLDAAPVEAAPIAAT